MKKLILSFSVTVVVISCNPEGPAGGVRGVSNEELSRKQLAAARQRWPGITSGQLDAGANIYRTKCIQCHGNYQLTGFTEDRWKYELGRMSSMAGLAPAEEEGLARYVLSMRDLEVMKAY